MLPGFAIQPCGQFHLQAIRARLPVTLRHVRRRHCPYRVEIQFVFQCFVSKQSEMACARCLTSCEGAPLLLSLFRFAVVAPVLLEICIFFSVGAASKLHSAARKRPPTNSSKHKDYLPGD